MKIALSYFEITRNGLSNFKLPLFDWQVPIEWESVDVTPVRGLDGQMNIPQKAIDSVMRNGVGLKGPLATPIAKGHKSLNLALRKWESSITNSSLTTVFFVTKMTKLNSSFLCSVTTTHHCDNDNY